MMQELIFAQALMLTGEPDNRNRELLRLLCGAAASSLELRLKAGICPQDCGEDFVTAASLYAVAALEDAREETVLEEFRAGDLTVRNRGADRSAASRALEKQAQLLMKPYLADSFSFLGV